MLSLPPGDLNAFYNTLHSFPQAAVIFYGELVRITFESLKKGYAKNVADIRRNVNSLMAFTVHSRLEELGTNQTFRSVQSQIKKASSEVVSGEKPGEKPKEAAIIDATGYLMKITNLSLDMNYDTDNVVLARVLCNLPLSFESTEVDYYDNLNVYWQAVTESDVKESGEAVFTLSVFLDNFEEIDYEYFSKVSAVITV